MSHTYTLNLLHVVFSTKNRAPLIRNLASLVKNLRGIARNKNIDVLAAGGTHNHVHLLLRIPPTRPVSESIRDLKANSSRYMSDTSGHFVSAGMAYQPSENSERQTLQPTAGSRIPVLLHLLAQLQQDFGDVDLDRADLCAGATEA